ncbi:hypothetical protein HVPorG_04240 [Roseomonas mucosa]|uniref:Uncharacterized protein n=1 Tax=Roseomonas mucosa TaxID=207340 RepID=A0A4Y1MWA4_9PROT|nr:hypothetical protein RADP37_04240 [Roseomonas mucosa]QDD94406.1 hypothetical protein HVIM_04240 [Roseomonas mucosa]QDD99514.1 hypothetical protein ADP8_04240 [Roseomonas mucosa]QDJ09229.1 hypothetical protein HVPorG_04240 [Roseomonas mucosa]UZO91705.1 hypothetical protein RMP42_04240 [Roseomonas mucosa]
MAGQGIAAPLNGVFRLSGQHALRHGAQCGADDVTGRRQERRLPGGCRQEAQAIRRHE